MSKLNMREKILVLLVAVAANFAIVKYGFLLLNAKAKDLDAKVLEARGQLAAETAELIKLAQERMPSSSATSDSSMRDYLGDNSQFTSLLRNLISENEFSGIEIVRISTEESEKAEAYTKTKYTVLLKAPYLSFGTLVEKLEESRLLVQIQGLEVVRDGDDLRRAASKLDLFHYVLR